MRYFLGIALIAILGVANAQDRTVKKHQGYALFTGAATDTINGATTADAVFYIEDRGMYTLSHFIDGDTLLGCTGNTTIQVQGSYDGVNYSNIGSAITWASSTAEYNTNVNLNTYTEVTASYTETFSGNSTVASYDLLGGNLGVDTIGIDADTIVVDPQVTTDARVVTVAEQTNTVTLPGYDYRYIKVLLTGASGTRVELEYVGLRVVAIKPQ